MRFLIFGGTRYIGRSLVHQLLAGDHHVTICSRKKLPDAARLACLVAERENCFALLKGLNFDCVVDFSAYNSNAVETAVEFFPDTPYIFVSTCWIEQFEKKTRNFSPYELQYVENKLRAELLLRRYCDHGFPVKVCRLPVTLGAYDHTNRLEFYKRRVLDNGTVISVGQPKFTQIAFKTDIVNALFEIITNPFDFKWFIASGLPEEHISVSQLVSIISDSLQKSCKIANYSEHYLAKSFPEYLAYDPLWRECKYSGNGVNLFDVGGIAVTPYSAWISVLAKSHHLKNDGEKSQFLSDETLSIERNFIVDHQNYGRGNC